MAPMSAQDGSQYRGRLGAALPLAAGVALLVVQLALSASEWQSGSGCRSAALTLPPTGKTGFVMLPPDATGIIFTNCLPESRHLTNQILLNGAGVAAGDVDGDGWSDLYFGCLEGSNRLYRNLGGWRFEDVTASAGVGCAGLTTTGVALADLDGDGDLDLVVNTFGDGTHLFYNDGQGRFAKAKSVLNQGKGAMSMALADVDGDGFLDLYLANYRTSALMDMPNTRATFKNVDGKTVFETVNGRPMTDPDLTNRFEIGPRGSIDELGEVDALYRNQGGTNFVLVPFTGGAFLDEDGKPLSRPPFDWGLTAAFRDLNGDTLPDLYVCNDFLTPDRCWLNQGGGKFRLLPRLAQRKSSQFSMAVDFADVNRDGWDDFLVLDMMSREHQQRMRYLNGLPPLCAIGRFDDRPEYGLNTLFLSRGDCTFAEIAQLSGLQASEWSWSCVFLDVDLDGWEDLLVANGMERAARDLDVLAHLKNLRATSKPSDAQIFQARRMFPRQATANLAFRNRGDLTFEETGRAWGFDWQGVSHGMALADLDNDGDLDVAVNNLNAAAGVFRNESVAARVVVRLKGLPANTQGIGARIKVLGGAVPLQTQEITCGGRYLSCDEAVRGFAAGSLTNRLTIEVTWRSGRRSVIEDAQPNRIYEVAEAGARGQEAGGRGQEAGGRGQEAGGRGQEAGGRGQEAGGRGQAPQPSALNPQPLFTDVSERLAHVHREEPFDDFSRQPLLPNKLSQLGPGVAWFDLDGDGWDELLAGSGKGGQLAVYHNDGQGGFRLMQEAPYTQPVTRDQTTVLGWRRAPGQPVVLTGLANYEDGLALGAAVRQYVGGAPGCDDSLPATEASTGPLAMADVDGDGDLDLFVGGRVIPGKYPAAASSRLFLNDGGSFRLDPRNAKPLEGLGLASGAVFSDLNGDGWADLVVACEWGPVRVFRNDHGQLVPWNLPLTLPVPSSSTLNPQPSTLNQLTGWWTGVAAGDFDGDGRLDLVAGNWGRNTKYEAHRSRPLLVYYGDFGGNGAVDVLEAHFDAGLQRIVPERQLDVLARSLPFLRGQFTSYGVYSTASMEEVLGEAFKGAKSCQANWLETTVFLNRGDHLEFRPLPVEAQMAPAFGICVGDCDGDGNEDVFLAQNFFAVQSETPRYDAGRGLWLKGDGRGGFEAMPGQSSGVMVYGEQRGAAVGDYDGDGRLDLVVAQNGAATKLFHSVGAKPGLRVRLQGPPGNLNGVGAAVRLVFGRGPGPLREVHAGAGYWSQDSSVQVLAVPEPPRQVWVRWPGGKTTTAGIPPGAATVIVKHEGGSQAASH